MFVDLAQKRSKFIFILLQIRNDAKDLILKLLEKNPKRRLGFKHGAEDLKRHKFFTRKLFNWDKLKNKELDAPFVPTIKDKEDVSMFSKDFTNMQVKEHPVDSSAVVNADINFEGMIVNFLMSI